jgi:hypothetical protein
MFLPLVAARVDDGLSDHSVCAFSLWFVSCVCLVALCVCRFRFINLKLGLWPVKVYERRRLEGGEMAIRLILDLYIYADYLYKGLHG